jgi:ribosomal protein S19
MKNNKTRLDRIIVADDKELLTEYQYMKQLKANNVIKERVELYRDFVINLIHHISSTYFGKEYIKTEEDIIGHYSWAFNKVLAEFEEEGINFHNVKDLKQYFFNYFYAKFYSVDVLPSIKYFVSFWDDIFDLKPNKTQMVFNALIEVYLIFDKALNRKENFVEK